MTAKSRATPSEEPDPEEVAKAAAEAAEPAPVNRRGTKTTEEQQEAAIAKAIDRLKSAGQYVEAGRYGLDATPTYAGYSTGPSAAPVQEVPGTPVPPKE